MKFGLIGNPVQGSLSPALFEAAYGGKYQYDLIEHPDFDVCWEKYMSEYKGINVTAPFKEQAFSKADSYTPYCQKIGASNLVVKTENGLFADNTDFKGIIMSIAEAYFPGIVTEFYREFGDRAPIKIHQFFKIQCQGMFAQKAQALIVGCGGAGRAAAVAAAELGFDVALMNRCMAKAQAIADEMPEYRFVCDPLTDFKAAFKECDLVIYTLPMKLDDIDSLEVGDFAGEDRYADARPSKVVLEANYKTPSFSGEARKKMEAGSCQYVPGWKWLLYQAVTGYSAFTGEMPDMTAMSERIVREVSGK